MSDKLPTTWVPGLEGIVAAQTRLSSVDGQAGELIFAGFRVEVLSLAAERLYRTDGDMALYEFAREVERTAVTLLSEYKPGRKLQTNVEFYTALLLHGLDLEAGLFTPTFAIGRVAGWTAHCLEQLGDNRLFRPQSVYTGVKNRRWVPVDER